MTRSSASYGIQQLLQEQVTGARVRGKGKGGNDDGDFLLLFCFPEFVMDGHSLGMPCRPGNNFFAVNNEQS